MGSVTYVTPGRIKAPDWISRLHQAHGVQLQQFLSRMTGSRQAAEEIAQETYLKLYRLCRPEDVECPRALLFDAATKLAITYLRRRRAEAAVTVDSDTAGELGAIPDDLARPDRRAAAEEAVERLNQVVERLPAGLKTVFTMRYLRQMPRHEIAEALQISVNALEQRLTKALALCRTKLAALGIELGHD